MCRRLTEAAQVFHRAGTGTKFCILPFPWEKVLILDRNKYRYRYLSTATSVADPHHVDADPDPAFHLDAKPDPDNTFHSDADLDPDPTLKLDPDPDPTTIFLQIGIQLPKMMRIRNRNTDGYIVSKKGIVTIIFWKRF